MSWTRILTGGLSIMFTASVLAQQVAPPAPDEAAKAIVARLDLERYKATIKGLTQFGDRRQGTDRNRAAVDWIEAQLKSYGCATERLVYTYEPPPAAAAARAGGRAAKPGHCQRGNTARSGGLTSAPDHSTDRREQQPGGSARRGAAHVEHSAEHPGFA